MLIIWLKFNMNLYEFVTIDNNEYEPIQCLYNIGSIFSITFYQLAIIFNVIRWYYLIRQF